MRILIQEPESKRYFDGVRWETSLETAMEFETVFSAEEFCRQQGIGAAMVVVKFNGLAAQDIKYAVGPANCLLTSKPPTTRIHRQPAVQ